MNSAAPTFTTRTALALALVVAATALLTGCLRPTLHVTSEPSGAMVLMEGRPMGKTPVEIPFIWYWFYSIELRRDGYETHKARERLYAPPYYYIPLDLIAEILPFTLHDRRYRHYFLMPERSGPVEG